MSIGEAFGTDILLSTAEGLPFVCRGTAGAHLTGGHCRCSAATPGRLATGTAAGTAMPETPETPGTASCTAESHCQGMGRGIWRGTGPGRAPRPGCPPGSPRPSSGGGLQGATPRCRPSEAGRRAPMTGTGIGTPTRGKSGRRTPTPPSQASALWFPHLTAEVHGSCSSASTLTLEAVADASDTSCTGSSSPAL